jgi:hypothetical protein
MALGLRLAPQHGQTTTWRRNTSEHYRATLQLTSLFCYDSLLEVALLPFRSRQGPQQARGRAFQPGPSSF